MISKEEVKRVAKLARLQLSEEEAARYQKDLNSVLAAAGKLAKINTDGVEPTAHAVPLENVFRPDQTRPPMSKEEVLQNGPEVVDGYFRVPRIMEEE